ncbi:MULTISPECIES: VapE domain-containing protein [unclassified Microcoleus]|uniref:VapE domain-containing protein n=1 Tax=unclassified Microcoleus TaxID=2642155 RepID=UPI002FD50CAB
MRIDRELVEKHLHYLGYQPGEAFLRFFYHSSDDRKKKDKGRKENGVDWETIENHQTDGRGVYIVVNGAGGGHTDPDITQCCAIFCEWDDILLAKQFEKWRDIGFVEPTFTIFSGDKSMQPYWLFDEPIAPEQWRELQVLLIQVMEADESNKNPSRVFRLAGAWHVKPDREPVKTAFVEESGTRYSYSDLRSRLLILYQEFLARKQRELEQRQKLLAQQQLELQQRQDLPATMREAPRPCYASASTPTPAPVSTSAISSSNGSATATATLIRPEQISQRYKELTVPVPMPISLQCALGKPNKEFLNGVATLRNTSMATLARDLIGVQSEFSRLGQITNEDAYTLFLDACRRCSPGGGWDEQEWEQIWNSAVKSNPIASISKYFSDGIESCIKGEYWRFLKSLQPDHLVSRMEAEAESDLGNSPNSATSSDSSPEFNILNSDDKMMQDYRKLVRKFGKRLRLNKLSKRIEIDGKPVSLDRVRIQLAIKHGILVKSSREDTQDILTEIAVENQYSPIEEYLNSLPPAADTSILDSLAQKYFGVNDPIYEMFVRKTLIGAVKRTFEPGCKIDTVLILQGKQGYRKSTFFKILAGGKYFDDSLGTVSDKDERLKLHQAWFVEWAELESVFRRRDVSATKAFLSTGTDKIRPPYCRDIEDFNRPSIIVATTNKQEFLADETGNRRFWIIPVKHRIDTKLLKQERDAIWAAAMLAYKSGEEPCLDYENEETAEQVAQEFQSSDPWEDVIENYIEHREYIRLSDLLTHLQVDLSRQERSHQMRCSAILKKFGWEREFRSISSKRVRVWCKTEPEPEPVSVPEPVLESELDQIPVELADRPQNLKTPLKREVDREDDHLATQGFDRPDQPDHPISEKILNSDPTSDPIADSTSNSTSAPTVDWISALAGSNSTETSYFPSFGNKVDQVDQVDQSFTQQSDQPSDRPRNLEPFSKNEVDQQPQQNDETGDLVEYIRLAIEAGDRETALDIQTILKEVCSKGAADRQKVWNSLTADEKTAFTALLSDPTPELIPDPTPELIPDPTPEPTPDPIESTMPIVEPAAIGGAIEEANKSEGIDEEDAQKLREIATIWWNEYYPEQLQNLLTQMYGWKAPGAKYSQEAIERWLEGEDAVVRDRIGQLIQLKGTQK